MKAHIRSRLLDAKEYGDEKYTQEELDEVIIADNTLYFHQRFQVHYMTYDDCRDLSTINAWYHPDIMLLTHEDGESDLLPHPYWYAHVIKIFHVNVSLNVLGPMSRVVPMHILWVRWLGREYFDPTWATGLTRISFVHEDDANSPPFGFVEPSDVIRGVHLIPAFNLDKTDAYLSPSSIRAKEDEGYDYCAFYVGR